MPFYDFRCKQCEDLFTVRATIKEKEEGLRPACPVCQASETQQVITAGILLGQTNVGNGRSLPSFNCGPDADSGTAVELGIARGQKLAYQRLIETPTQKTPMPKIITYRTDFRTDLEKEVGVNGMLRPEESELIFHPCYAIETAEFETFYKELASKIIDVVKRDFR